MEITYLIRLKGKTTRREWFLVKIDSKSPIFDWQKKPTAKVWEWEKSTTYLYDYQVFFFNDYQVITNKPLKSYYLQNSNPSQFTTLHWLTLFTPIAKYIIFQSNINLLTTDKKLTKIMSFFWVHIEIS